MQDGSTALKLSIPAASLDREGSLMDRAEAEFEGVANWLLSTETRGIPIHQVEGELMERGREILRLMLEAHIRSRGTGRVGPALLVVGDNGESKRYEQGRENSRKLKSLVGPVEVIRQAYSSPGKDSLYPLEASLSLPEASFSYGLQRCLIKECIRGPMDEARESVEERTGVNVGKGSVEAILNRGAADFDAFYEQRHTLPADETGSLLVAELDGKGVPMIKSEGTTTPSHLKKGQKRNKKKMATVAAVYTAQPRVRTPEEVTESLFKERKKLTPAPRAQTKQKRNGPENKRVWASLKKSKDEVFNEVSAECQRRDPDQMKQRVALTDGERALKLRVLKWLQGFRLILDLLHVLQRLWKASQVFNKEGSPEAIAWVKERTRRILEGKVVSVVQGIRISATKRGLRGAKLKIIEDITGYLYRNREFMRYDECLAKGLPICGCQAPNTEKSPDSSIRLLAV